MSVRQEELVALNQEIWASMLGITISSIESVELPAHGAGSIGSCVQLVGAWEGAVRIDCTLLLAQQAAKALLGEDADVSIDQLRDTVGELANMAAGSLKPLLPQPTHISLPSVADGRDYDLTVRKGRVLLQCSFDSQGERLLVSLIERDRHPEDLSSRRPITQSVQ
jgi:chemotaxis protein CheX